MNGMRRGTLFVGLCVVLAVGATARAADRAEMITVDAQGMKFAPVPGMPGCATVAMLRGNPRREASVVLVKLAGGCRVPWHWHTPNEQLLVVSGVGVLDMKEGKPLPFRPGAYASLPSHHVHQARCSRTCLFFSIADDAFDIHYVDNAGNEIPEDEALKKQAVRKARRK